MAPTLLPQSAAPDLSETALEFPDNYLLIDLCGQHDRNLARIEERSGVQILRRGNRLSVVGDAAARSAAVQVLRTLYHRLETGRSLEPGDIESALRAGEAPEPPPEGQMEMFRGVEAAQRIEIQTRRKVVEPRTEAQKAYVRALFENELRLRDRAGGDRQDLSRGRGGRARCSSAGQVDKIILSRPAVEAGERLGFLPGDMKDKVDPYMQPLYDALNDFLPGKQVGKMMEEKVIEIAPLAFMRGRTLSNAFVVLDEAQNATSMQMKMFLTRLGEGSRDGDHGRSQPGRPAAGRGLRAHATRSDC